MRVGTKSVLFGAHQLLLHPLFVAIAWRKLRKRRPDIYFSMWSLPLWASFFLHDIGYLGKSNMDGDEGEDHPILGACIVSQLFDEGSERFAMTEEMRRSECKCKKRPKYEIFKRGSHEWHCPLRGRKWLLFCLLHSRFTAKIYEMPYSPLCVADKLAFCITPRWLYMLTASVTGEIREYMKTAESGQKHSRMSLSTASKREWHKSVKKYLSSWVDEHVDLKRDEWTKDGRTA